MTPFFSVCIPVYNGMEYLPQCLASVFNQGFKDFEIIVVDDCSHDGSFSYIDTLAKDDKRLRCFRNESNLGLVGNWNECLKKSTGIWIKFLFQDDTWEPNCLERVFEVALRHSFIFHGRRFFIDSEVDESLKSFYSSVEVVDNPLLNGASAIGPGEMSRMISKKPGLNFYGEPSNVAFRRELIDQFGMFDTRLAQLCDYEYWCRLASNVGGYYIQDKLSWFKVHAKSTSSANLVRNNFRYKYLDRLIILNEFSQSIVYANLRLANDPSFFSTMLAQHAEMASNFVFSAGKEERLLIRSDVFRFAPFLSSKFSSVRYVAFRIEGVIKRLFSWMSR